MTEHDARDAQTPEEVAAERELRIDNLIDRLSLAASEYLDRLEPDNMGFRDAVRSKLQSALRETADAARAEERAQIDENYLETRYVRFDVHERAKQEARAAGKAEGAAEGREQAVMICDALANMRAPDDGSTGLERRFGDMGEDAARTIAKRLADIIRSPEAVEVNVNDRTASIRARTEGGGSDE